MQNTNTWIIALIVLAALAVIVFLVIRNLKDRKELLPPGSTDDATEETRMDQQRRQDKL